MDIKGNSFIESVMIAAAFSKIDSVSNEKKSPVQKLEMRIYNLLDAILSKISSAYRESKIRMSNKIMLIHEKEKFKPVQQAVKKILPIQEETTTSGSQNLEPQKQTVREPEERIQKETSERDVDHLPDYLRQIDVNALLESNPEIEEKAKDYNEMIAERRLQESMAEFNQYLIDNPGAFAGFLLFLQAYTAQENELPDFLKDIDVEGLQEVNPEIEEKARAYNRILAERQEEEDMVKFNQYLIDNPGALAGFLLVLQAYASGNQGDTQA